MSAENKTKGMCIATRCTSVDQFVQMFHRFVDEDSFFVSTHNTRPPGLETSFSVQLADGTPVLRGLCVVLQAWTNANNVFKTPGVRLGIKRLTANSMPVFERLLVTRSSPTLPPPVAPAIPPIPKPNPDKTTELKREHEDNMPTKVAEAKAPPSPPSPPVTRDDTEADLEPEIETRTPGSDYILPANPLQNLTDASLDGFVDCTLYEETGNFFPADGEDLGPMLTDDVVPPPALAPVTRNTPSPMQVVPAMPALPNAVEVSSLIRLSQPIQVQTPAGEVTVSSVVAPLPANSSVVTPLPMPMPLGGSSVVTPLPLPTPPVGTSVVTPLPQMPQMLGGATVEATPLPLPPPPLRETPVPAGERIDLAPRTRRKSRAGLWAIGGGGLVVAGVAVALIVKSTSSSNAEPPPAKQPPAAVVAQADLPKPPPTTDETATDKTDDNTTPSSPTGATEDPDGPPMIGDGPCKLTVATTPAGSTISLDGKSLAPSPLTIATTCDKHQIQIEHVRYETTTRSITLDEAKPGTLEVSLNRPTHAVSMTSTPPGATIFIDGRRAGTTPTVVNVIGFQKLKLEFKKTGYLPQNTTLYSKVPQDKVAVKLGKW